jgi:hypothetical protein
MVRTFALLTVFAISLFALPTKSTNNVVPLPSCSPCPELPWSN